MELQSILDPVTNHLRKKGIEPDLICGPRVTEGRLKKVEIKIQKPVSLALLELYQAVGDGFVFTWSAPKNRELSGSLHFAPLKELLKMQQDWRDHAMWMGDYDFPYVDDKKLAKSTYGSMKSWSKVCFQTPSSLWWPSVFKAWKVNWGSAEFNRRFVLRN